MAEPESGLGVYNNDVKTAWESYIYEEIAMLKGLFIYNPKSGNHSIKNNLDNIFEKCQEAGILLLPFRLFQNGNCTRSLLDIFNSDVFNFAIVYGGDGSMNYVANVFIKNGINIPLGIFPGGTCNDFSRSIGMTNNIDDWPEIIMSGKIKYVDAGLINNHQYFLGNMCGGMFANVSFHTGNELKKNIGVAAYYLKAFDKLPKVESFSLFVETENCKIYEDVILFLVINGRNVAGLADFFKKADIEDGLLDIVLFKIAKPMELFNLFIKILSRELTGDDRIIHIQAKDLKIQSDKQVQINVDGESGTLLPLHVKCVHPGLKLFVNN
ncbi:MAG: YegS/Rv2252/BmrU family lipid kinase [Clostridiaceae bacterium]|nr:YegS/Rv2252/BmrU family lipid kinase [Clostridiaceae bacterium]